MPDKVQIIQADALHLPLEDQSVDLVFGSGPYTDCRTYDDGTLPEGHVVSMDCQEWVQWMLKVTTEALRVSKGAVVWVAWGPTRDRNYQPACEGLIWEWFKQGGSMYRPCYWRRIGIPGSGGDDWFRGDIEYVMCFKRPGPLPWADNTAMGHVPEFDPGGAMSHRSADGTRANDPWKVAKRGGGVGGRRKDGSKKLGTNVNRNTKIITRRDKTGSRDDGSYTKPAISNPGNLINTGAGGSCNIAKMGSKNEAPFPEFLAEWFIRSLCPPDGVVLDPFSGSGTTAAVAVKTGRRAIASDIRTSQTELTLKRINSGITPELFN